MKPIARKNELIVESDSAEFFIHDLRNQKYITLNPTSAYVWQKCDGKHEPADIAEEIRDEFGLMVSPSLIDSAIARLSADCLLETYPQFV